METRKSIVCFIICAAFISLIYFFLIPQHRLPAHHDTFQILQNQYLFYNEVIQNKSIPLWIPFCSQGITSTYYLTPQLTLLTPLIYVFTFFSKGTNYLYLFYLAVWFEELFFLMGVILLSRLFYRDFKTILFVGLSLVGTNIWNPQIFWNFHQYYFIPLVLYCLHQFSDTKKFRYVAFGLLFFALNVYGNFFYCGVFTSFLIGIYFIIDQFNRDVCPVSEEGGVKKKKNHDKISPAAGFLKKVRRVYVDGVLIDGFKGVCKNKNLHKLLLIAGLLIILALSFYFVKYGGDQLVYVFKGGAGDGRNADGTVTLNTFLSYGGALGLPKYGEVFQRFGKEIDVDLYGGFALVPFVILALLFSRRKKSYAVAWIALVVFLFSVGTFVAKLFYYAYPLGNIFRHIGLTAAVFKLFIILYAGFGFEVFCERVRHQKKYVAYLGVVLLPLIYFLVTAFPQASKLLWFVTPNELEVIKICSFIVYGALVLLIGWWWFAHKKNNTPIFIYVLLLLIGLDLFLYKYAMIVTRMPRATQEQVALFKPHQYVPSTARLLKTFDYEPYNERLKAFKPYITNPYGYNTVDWFFYVDPITSSKRVDFVLRPIKEYFSLVNKYPNAPAYSKISGLQSSKIRLFSKLNVAEDNRSMGEIFHQKSFTGDMLFTTQSTFKNVVDERISQSATHQNTNDFTNRNEERQGKIFITAFSHNTVKFHVRISGPSDQYLFLYYADAFHPDWNVYVNGRRERVIQSNVGYKSVLIPYGTSDITFKFEGLFYDLSILATMLMSATILGLIFYLFYSELLNPIKKTEF
ncbi:hypothetical protein ACFL49_02095 [Candidatus Omnitrophota bacterium]